MGETSWCCDFAGCAPRSYSGSSMESLHPALISWREIEEESWLMKLSCCNLSPTINKVSRWIMTRSCSLAKMHGSTLFISRPSSSSLLAKKCCQSLGCDLIPYTDFVSCQSTLGSCSSSVGGSTSTSSWAMGAWSTAELKLAVITSHLLIKLKVRRIFKLMCDDAHVGTSRSKSCCLKLVSRILASKLTFPSHEDCSRTDQIV